MRAAIAASLVAVVAAAAAHTQVRDPAAVQRDAVAPSGAAVVSGVLTTDTPPRPVRRATIRLSGAGASTRLVGTDDEGRFVFDALPAGTFTLSATKPGYVQTFFGSKHPGRGPGMPVAVVEGQHVEVALEIVRGAVITGTIVDARGNPTAKVPLAILGAGARTASARPARGVTDDRGVYRVFGLAPGDYLVAALPSLGSGAAGRGMASDVAATTEAEVRWARSTAGLASIPPAGRPVTYAPVFYPGTADAGSATRVTVAVGEERPGIDLALQIVPTARIAGTIVDAGGQPVPSAAVFLYPRRGDGSSPADAIVSSGALTLPRATVTTAGFSIPGVAPGEYTILARSGPSGRGRSAEPAPSTTALWCVTDVTVEGRDQPDLVLRLVPGVKLSGTIRFEATSLTPPADMSAIDLSLRALGSSLGLFSTLKVSVAANGAFTFASVVPWIYTLKATPAAAAGGARWILKSAVLNGRDLADGAFELKPGSDIAGLTITFTDRAAEISGRLIDEAGRPLARYSVVVFPTNRTLWLPDSRRIRSAAPATDGKFTVAGLPSGEYAIAAAEDIDAIDLADASFLKSLLASAFKVTLADGERKRQDLRIPSPPGKFH